MKNFYGVNFDKKASILKNGGFGKTFNKEGDFYTAIEKKYEEYIVKFLALLGNSAS